jgi:hypothetical protein
VSSDGQRTAYTRTRKGGSRRSDPACIYLARGRQPLPLTATTLPPAGDILNSTRASEGRGKQQRGRARSLPCCSLAFSNRSILSLFPCVCWSSSDSSTPWVHLSSTCRSFWLSEPFLAGVSSSGLCFYSLLSPGALALFVCTTAHKDTHTEWILG